jgi:O-antigen ligase
MKLSYKFSKSYLFRGLDFLFGPRTFFNLSESRLVSWLNRFNRPYVSEIAVGISIFLVFYKGLLGRFVPLSLSLAVPLLLLVALVFVDKKKLVFNKPALWLGAFLMLLMFSGFWAIFSGANPVIIFLGILLYLQFVLAFLVGQGVGQEKVGRNVIALSMPAAIYGIWQYLSGSANSQIWFSSFENLNATRAFAWFGSPNVLGIVMAFVAALSLFELLAKKKVVFGVTFAVSLFALFATYSRTAWLGFAIATAICLVVMNYKYIFVAPLALLVLLFGSIRNRIFALLNPQYLVDASLDGRLWAVTNGGYLWSRAPIFGYGPGSYGGQIAQTNASPIYLLGMQNGYTPLYFTDNQWLELLIQGGIFALVAIFAFFTSAVWEIAAIFKVNKNRAILGSLAVLIILGFSGIFANVLEFGAVALPAGLIIGGALNES